MLVARGIVKTYGGVSALAGADLQLRPGQVHALLGENGAGKSTLVRIVTGLEQPDAGELLLDGSPVHWRTALAARASGVATVSQELSLFGDLDLLANLFSHGPPTRWGLVDRDEMLTRARPHLRSLGLADLDPRTLLAGLSLAEQQLVEIARALIAGPSVLVLDEPTSALGAAATSRLLALVREIADGGVAVLYVSHFLQEVTAIADRVTVLRDGMNTITDREMSTPGAPSISDLVRAMLGTADTSSRAKTSSRAETSSVDQVVEAVSPSPSPSVSQSQSPSPSVSQSPSPSPSVSPSPSPSVSQSPSPSVSPSSSPSVSGPRSGPGSGRLALQLRSVCVPGSIEDVDLDVHQGEIVGLTGLQGAGHEVLLRLLWGLQPEGTGQVQLPGARGVPRSPGEALRAGVAFIPSDRKRLGLMLDKPVWENITAVTALSGQRSSWRLRRSAQRALAQRWVDELRIRCVIDAPVSALSGGNQQKVVFAKWLAVDPGLLLLDDPTRGVDVGAKREMHDLIRGLAAQGRTVLICSTDLAELAELCDRVVLLRRGRLLETRSSGRMSEGSLLEAMNSADRDQVV